MSIGAGPNLELVEETFGGILVAARKSVRIVGGVSTGMEIVRITGKGMRALGVLRWLPWLGVVGCIRKAPRWGVKRAIVRTGCVGWSGFGVKGWYGFLIFLFQLHPRYSG